MDKMHRYIHMLLEANRGMNLTGANTVEELTERHVKDSLALLDFVELREGMRVLDMGTGAGFPGIPLAIQTDASFVLVDSLKKRVDFLSKVCEELELRNVALSDLRAEEFLRVPAYRESFDIVVSRALAPLNLLLEYTIPGLKVGGKFYSYKSSNLEEEICSAETALQVLRSEITYAFDYTVRDGKGEEIHLKILEITKREVTDAKYPRRVGVPAKRPL
ncbi:MAG: 16S rRNA (guanine(527)-N(7))-methyltransferase RsmG [Bacillota bacterium]|nr:16S rRNA (guanine(527)-N(7))-methyltransferase RsmG [Bacillota bacterium]